MAVLVTTGGALAQLTELHLEENQLTVLPESIGNLASPYFSRRHKQQTNECLAKKPWQLF